VIQVLIADDQALVRGGFRVLVDSDPELHVVGEAANGVEAVELAQSTNPDVILMDIRMPVMDGLEATRAILSSNADVRVLVLTTFDLDEYVVTALPLGASGFLLKDTPPQQLLNGIRTVAAGEALVSPQVMRRLIEQFVTRSSSTDAWATTELSGLTEREQEVLKLVARGWSNTEIADRLYVTPATVKTHVSRLLMKLQARDRAQLIVLSYETGLVKAGPAT
jgi:DNA-binding NarL/FixJ family response regulator